MRGLVHNFSFLTLGQVVNISVLLMTYPYLVDTLGIELYGYVIVGQTYADFVMVAGNFGFEISGVKGISSMRSNIYNRNVLVSQIYILKIFSFVILFSPIYFFASWSLPNEFQNVVLPYLLSGVFAALIPYYFFQGIERMGIIFVLKGLTGLFYLLLVMSLVRAKADLVMVPYIKLSVELFGLVTSLFFMSRAYKYRFVFSSIRSLVIVFKDSATFFVSKVGNILSQKIPLLLVNFTFGSSFTTLLDFTVKIYSVCQIPLDVLASVVFPNAANTYDNKLIKKMITINVIAATSIYILVNIGLAYVLQFFFKDIIYDDIRVTFFIYGMILLFNAGSSLLGTSVLISNGYYINYLVSIFVGLGILLIGLYIGHIQQSILTVYVSIVFSSVAIAAYRVHIAVKNRLLTFGL